MTLMDWTRCSALGSSGGPTCVFAEVWVVTGWIRERMDDLNLTRIGKWVESFVQKDMCLALAPCWRQNEMST